MPFTEQVFAAKIKALRESLADSLERVSTNTGISLERLGALEGAKSGPTGDEILILADYFSCDFSYLIEDSAINPDENVNLLFRVEGDRLSSADRHAIQEFIFLCRSQSFLEELLNRRPDRLDFVCKVTGSFYKGHGWQCAEQFRARLGLASNAVVPDIFALIRRTGIKVFRRSLPDSLISGLFVSHPDAGRCVLVNYKEDLYRQRFSAAHECGHALLDTEKPFNVSSESDWLSQDRQEIRANTFASHFLMPPALLKAFAPAKGWTDPDGVLQRANELFVTVPALLSALKNAGLIDESARQHLRGLRLRPPTRIDPELPHTLTQQQRARKEQLLQRGLADAYVALCFDAYDQAAISRGKLAELLLADISEVVEIGQIYGRTLRYE